MDLRQIEETLCRLPEIDAVRIVGDRNHITEIHVLASPSKPAKQLVRDIQSLAMARFGVGIDRKTVSVVQIAPEQRGTAEGERPIIASVIETPSGSKLAATVTLAWRGMKFEGTATGPSAQSARLRIIGEAALHALEEALGGGQPFALEAVSLTHLASRPLVLAQVVSMSGPKEEVAIGSALVRSDEPEATVRAVLDAVNRRIPSLTRG